MKNRLDYALPHLIWNQFVEFIFYYIGAAICLYATHWIGAKLPFFAKELAEMAQTGSEGIEITQFIWLALGIIVFRTSSRLLFFYPARVQQKNLRVELLSRLEKVSPNRYEEYPPGQLFQILGDDLEQIRALIGFALLQIGNIIIAMIVLVPKVVNYNSQLVLPLLPLIVAFLLFTAIVASNKKFYKRTQDLQGEVKNFLMESYDGKQTIKNYHAEKSFIQMFKEHSYKELYNFYRAGVGISFSIPLIPLGLGASLIWGAVIIKQQELGASSLVLYSGLVFLFLEPLMFLSWIGVVYARAHASWIRIRGLVKKLQKTGAIEKQLMSFNGKSDLENLKLNVHLWDEHIKFNFKKSRWTALVGQTGHGKTFVLSQFAEVFKAHKFNLSYVAQDPYLYNDTVGNNIFLGREESERDYERAKKYLKLFDLAYLASSLDDLLDMEVGENGKKVSGGQAKRICLIRSLMSDAEILIWDDPFSSVDVISEKNIIEFLRKDELLKNKTMILSSHRITTVRASDEVYLIDKEQGIMAQDSVELAFTPKHEVYEFFKGQLV